MTIVRTLGALVLGVALMAGALPAVAQQAVRVTVNDRPITDGEIAARARLFTIEGKSASTSAAQNELIDEALMLSEAQKLGIVVSDDDVNGAYENVARNVRLSTSKLTEMLQQSGINPDTLRARLRAGIAWQRVVQQVVASGLQVSDAELEQQAAGRVNAANSFDYILKEIIFVGGGSGGRVGQANNYRSKFAGCDTAVDVSLGFTDAAVIDVGRRHATQLPEAISKELAGLNVGGITKPRVVQNGVSMLAVCEKTEARDTTFIKNEIRAEVGNSQMQGKAKEYLEEVRGRSKIVRN